MTGYTHVQPGDFPLRIQPGHKLTLRNRMITPVQHILFTRPEQFHWHARHRLGDDHRLGHPVVHTASPKAAAQMQLIYLALRGWQTSRLRCRRQRRLAVLGRSPNLTALRRPFYGRVHGFHCDMVLVRARIHRLNLACRRRYRCPCIAILPPDHRIIRV